MYILLVILILAYSKNIECKYTFDTKYADVLIDHFSYTSNKTFKLRYLVNETFWTANGPIFFYTGNEGDIELFAQNSGFIMELAPKFNALIVFCEHRYYGDSMPFGNLSYTKPEYLGYLSSEQALHDFVDIIDILQNSKYGSDGPLPVIAFGGSYGGMLSSWLRIKYPATVQGAIAASAPIWQFTGLTPCGVFYSIVTHVYASANEKFDCSISIKNLWPAIRRVANTPDGMTWLNSAWKLCNNITNTKDVQKLIDAVSNALVNMAMANYPYANTFLADLPPYPVKAMCSELIEPEKYMKDDKKLILALGKALNIYTNYSRTAKCNDFSDTDALGISGWDFQSCTEMVMPMCTNPDDMFEPSAWDYDKVAQDCLVKFGVKPSNPREVVLQYGGKNLKYASNIVFSNGLLDPWSGGGVLSNISSTVTAIVIPEGAHHLDLRESNPADPASVIRARKFHSDSIQNWITDFYRDKINSNFNRVLLV
ncbi:hypothetical protein WA026_004644 [Henosepilachna vigintioctopunctata]|uniref:Lysosomal Pro-X carboxypeptidase n=1 Tax=Henosepilachna vigintioctopunctata TaxID=420089 RepID=A0AAW1VAM5_9CUCU